MATATVSARSTAPQPQILEFPIPSEAARHHLAVRLADAIVNRNYAPQIWSMYRRRFLETLQDA